MATVEMRPAGEPMTPRGRLHVGTSGFSYTAWAPRFYPPGTRGDALLPAYASRLGAVELNNTFYQHPTASRVEGWLAQTPDDFRFAVKAQKGGSIRALRLDAATTVPWLSAPYRWFGERLGSVLFRVPSPIRRDDAALTALLSAWPAAMPLTVEFQDPSWHDDAILSLLERHAAALCATDLDDAEPPDVRLTGRFVYLRLRRSTYPDAELDAWARRIAPFLEAGNDAYVFFRHDESGDAALRAVAFRDRMTAVTVQADP